MTQSNTDNSLASQDRELLLWWHDFYLPVFEYMLPQRANLRGKRVLELGAGTGGTAVMLARNGASVTGIDLLPFRLIDAEKRAEEHGVAHAVQFLLMDAMQLGFEDNTFDFIVSKSVLVFTDHQRAAQECYRVLKPGGKAMFVENMRNHPVAWLYRKIFLRYSENLHYFSIADVIRFGRHFNQMEHREFHLLAVTALFWKHLLPIPPLYRLNFKGLRAIDKGLLKLFSPLKHFCWITAIICKKT